MHFHQRASLLIFAPLFRRTGTRRRDGDAGLFRYDPDSIRESALFHFHHELENIAAYAATKTVIDLLHRMNRERWRFLRMKRAQTREILPALFQTHIFANHANNVRLLLHLIRE